MAVAAQANLSVMINGVPHDIPIQVGGGPKIYMEYNFTCGCGRKFTTDDPSPRACYYCLREENRRHQAELDRQLRTRNCARCGSQYHDNNEVMAVFPLCEDCIRAETSPVREPVTQEPTTWGNSTIYPYKEEETPDNVRWQEEGF